MDKKDFAFGKTNFILIGISMIVVIIGFLLMTGASSTHEHFDIGIFSAMRIKVAPIICLIGFLSIIGGIMYKPKEER